MMSLTDLDDEISDAVFMAGLYLGRSGKQAAFWRRHCKRFIRMKINMIQKEGPSDG